MIDRQQQRQQFAAEQTNRGLQQAMQQYQSWQQKNPQQPAVSVPQSSPQSVTQMRQATPGGSNTSYSQAWNAAAPVVNRTRQIGTTDPVRGIPSQTTQTLRTTAARSFGGEGQGNLAYMPSDKRPAAFQAAYNDFDGSLRDSPVTSKRDALIERINEVARPYYESSGVRDTTMGQQRFDMPALMRQAGDMASRGYVNPLLQGLFSG